MTVILKVKTADGKELKCDQRCYLATGSHCDCACGGINHGVGLKQAIENVRKIHSNDPETVAEVLEGLQASGIKATEKTLAGMLQEIATPI